MRVGVVVAAIAIAATACGTTAEAPPDPPTSTLPPSTSSTPTAAATPPLRTTPCSSSPPVDWAPLCRSFDLVEEWYVDEVDPAGLAAAAALGVQRAVEVEPESAGRTRNCYVPHPAFASTCDTIVSRLGPDDDPGSYVDAATDGLFRYGLDPYSWYLPTELAERLGTGDAGVVVSMGLVVATLDAGGDVCAPISGGCRLSVLTVLAGGPAEQAGLRPGDELIVIDGTVVDGLTLAEATLLLEGEAAGDASLSLVRDDERVEKVVPRDVVEWEPVEYDVLGNGILYLKINQFSVASAQLTGSLLEGPDGRTDARAVILDLRDNPGGLVVAAQAIASQFLEGGEVMIEETRDGRYAVPVLGGGYARDPSIEVVVLVNRASASASEVVSAVLQERGRAVVVGEPTFGKHLVQRPFDLGREAVVNLTVARWTTPGGRSVAITGVEPDVVVAGSDEGDAALDRAVDLLSG